MATLVSCNLATDGSTLIVDISTDQDDSLDGPVTVNLAYHDDVTRDFFASLPCQRSSSGWHGTMNLETSSTRRLLELVQISNNDRELVSIQGRQLFLEPVTDGPWQNGAPAEAKHKRLESARLARFDQPLVAPRASDSDQEFMVIMLADNLHLTNQQHVPGISVIPLSITTLGKDVAEVLNAVLAQIGIPGFIEEGEWLTLMRRMRPAAIIRAARVRAADAETARSHCRDNTLVLLDLLALRRGDTPHLLGGMICGTNQAGAKQFLGAWVEGPGYAGNMMGGFISGEDAHDLLTQWRSLSSDPRTRLWLSLYADAIADDRWDYKLFRCFNLLEGIGSEILPKGKVILDSVGNPRLMAKGKPYTTDQARGKVYELIHLVSTRGHLSEGSFTPRQANGGAGDLWSEVGLWVSVRNDVAHRGTWRIPDGQMPSTGHTQVETEIFARSINNDFASGAWGLVNTIKSATEFVLHSAFMGRL